MTPTLTRLRDLAECATPGPWKYDGGNWQVEHEETREPICDPTAECDAPHEECEYPRVKFRSQDGYFIAAANPQTVLALISAIETLREGMDRIAEGSGYAKDELPGEVQTARAALAQADALIEGIT